MLRTTLLALATGALLALLAACSGGADDERRGGRGGRGGPGGGPGGGSGEPPPVEALQARRGTLPLEERVSGTVRAGNQITVRPRISAPVTAVLVRSGDAVSKGQPLVRLDDAEPRERLRQAEASLELARGEASEARARRAEVEAQTSRTRALAEQELVSTLDLETQEARLDAADASAVQAQARVAQAEATVDERRAALAETVVRAPIAGTVGQRRVEVGQQVDPGTTLFELGDLESLRVEVPLTEEMLGRVRAGQTVRIEAPSLERPIEAELTRVSPFLAESSFSTVGEIDLEAVDLGAGASSGAALRPGMFVRVDVLYGESEEATLVPTSALWDDPRTGVRGVFVLAEPPETSGDDPRTLSEPIAVSLRRVDVLAEGRATLGLAGVEPGEWVVTVGQHLISAGEDATARVRPARWEQVLDLQSLQREDLLAGFLERQRAAAATHGATPPSNEEFLAVRTAEASDTAKAREGRGVGEG